jgi:23S rRNA-/tRNA-specific pseudouridylate synthase
VSEPLLRVVTREGGPRALGAIAEELGMTDALVDGRVFVAAKRLVDPSHEVGPGSVIEVHAAREIDGEAQILATHGELIFAYKPPGMSTEPDHAGIDGSLVARVSALSGVPRADLSAPSRLDVGVSGVVTLARGAGGRNLVEALRKQGRFVRRYIGIACAAPEPARGEWAFPVGRGAGTRRKVGGEGARAARSRYADVAHTPPVRLLGGRGRDALSPLALIALEPVTGRTHQLRVHAAAGGAPLLGDPSYGGVERVSTPDGSVVPVPRVALHAARVELELILGRVSVVAPPARDLVELWIRLGGVETSFAEALAVAW